MKGTTIMLTFLGAFIITWMTLGLLVYLLSDIPTYKECITSGPVMLLMLMLGWIPAFVISSDVQKELNYR